MYIGYKSLSEQIENGEFTLDLANYYSRTSLNTLLDDKADANDVYTTLEVDTKLTNYDTSGEVDTKISNAQTQNFTAISETARKTLIDLLPEENKEPINKKLYLVRPSIDLKTHKKFIGL